LPEAHTDFIFPIVAEELGAIVTIVIILAYILMLQRIVKIALKAKDLKGSIMAYGVFVMILAHLLINFLGVLALIPITGISVPFLSYGGSFYLVVIASLFLVQRVQIESIDATIRRVSHE
jgi:cell division protein FtsW (lipid II flippase)